MPARLDIQEKLSADAILPKRKTPRSPASEKLIAIGSSTGGTQVIESILAGLDRNIPGVVIVQHMPEAFTESFALRLDSSSGLNVKQAQDGDKIEAGKVLISPGDKHMIVENRSGNLFVRIKEGPPVSRHRPSVDVLFRSVAQAVANQSLGIILTGMGDDGAIGMKEMFDSGAFTVAQDEESCVVFGMPSVAIQQGGVKKVCSPPKISQLMKAFNQTEIFQKLIK
ncbi:MAG: CheB methylesterase domain-containing protein [Gammaproteobacteria bacterium]|nr:CheB methylesterase domain-containing protein [Gammaproteobacteria bacterium]